MTRGLVDFHCHLDLYPDHAAAIAAAEAAEIYTLTVTTTPRAWDRNRELTEGGRYVRAALGLHPQLVAERGGELPLWERLLDQTRYVGEVGLDGGPRYHRSIDDQARVFTRVLEACAEAGGKILTLHSVRAAGMVLGLIEKHLPQDRGRVVLHWFGGTPAETRRATALGCYFSVNADMGRTARGRALISSLPGHRILTETDGPFTQVDGRLAEPRDVGRAVKLLAEIRCIDVDDQARAVRRNLRGLLSIDEMAQSTEPGDNYPL